MQNSEFEKKVQQKMEELKFTPADAVWQKVEAELPKEKKRRWIVFLLLFAGLAAGSFLFMNQYKNNDKKILAENNTTKKNDLQNSITPGKGKTVSDTAAVLKNESLNIVTDDNSKQNSKLSSLQIKIKQADVIALNNEHKENLAEKNNKRLKIKGKTGVTIKNPSPASVNEEVIANETVNIVSDNTVKNTFPDDTASLPINNLKDVIGEPEIKKIETTAATEFKIDTVLPSSSKKIEKKINNLKWQYGIYLATGISNVKNSLFSNAPVFSDRFANAILASPPNPQVAAMTVNPSKAIAFSVGLYAQKNINDRLKLTTGVNYFYQSNSIRTGSRVDSMTNYNYDVNKNIAADYYYKTGNSASYKNKFHLIEMPFLFQYKLLKKSSLYIDGGPSVAFLINSNALVYNSNSSGYFTDRAIFNKLLFSINAGAGIDLAQKTKMPFSVGYRFNYGIVSVTKKSFGKQHLVNSLLYLEIPLKK